jgi:uncharacterized protein involved in high-affinity Fe2+ transport
MRRVSGPLITAVILGGVILILVLNLNLGTSPGTNAPSGVETRPGVAPKPPAMPERVKPKGFREYPIGEEVEKNGIRVAAVWLPAIMMDGQGASGSDIIHLEADVRAGEGNPNGFALGEFVPYLKITYTIAPAAGGPPVQQGELMPMVAADGLHYGASVALPKAGEYKLTYAIRPPSAGGLGRHSDPVTGVAAWWEPFEARYDWDYPGPPPAK